MYLIPMYILMEYFLQLWETWEAASKLPGVNRLQTGHHPQTGNHWQIFTLMARKGVQFMEDHPFLRKGKPKKIGH